MESFARRHFRSKAVHYQLDAAYRFECAFEELEFLLGTEINSIVTRRTRAACIRYQLEQQADAAIARAYLFALLENRP